LGETFEEENVMRKLVLIGLVLMAVFVVTNNNPVWAQTLASITGRVEDPSKAAVPGVTITVKDLETGATRTAVTDAGGEYQVLSLAVGRYEEKAEKTGFETAVQTGINLVVGQQAVVNLDLVVGSVQQSVTVNGLETVVNTTTAQVSGLVGEVQVKDLPLNGRSFDNLITLNPGTVNFTSHSTLGSAGGGTGNMFSVEGERPENNLYLLNGVELEGSSTRAVTPGGASGELLGIDGIREFNILTDAYSAQYGKRTGGQVLIETQSGTNTVHGTVFEFLRNSVLDSRNYFDAPPSQIGHRLPEYQRNQFGAALGGPIWKDKVFLFGNYEALRLRWGLSEVAVVPDTDARMGELPNSSGVETPVAGLNTGMLPFMALWPLENGADLGGGLAYSYGHPKQSASEDYGTMRADENLSSKDIVSEIYTADDGYNHVPQSNYLFIDDTVVDYQVASIQETHIFSPSLINNFRAGLSRATYTFNVPPNGVTFSSSLSMVAGLEPGEYIIGGGGGGGATSSAITAAGNTTVYNRDARNLFTFSDDVQKIKGKQQFSFGVWYQDMEDNMVGASRIAGEVSFASLTSFLQGVDSSFEATGDPHPQAFRSKFGAWYAEDNISLLRNLTLRIGVRQETSGGWTEAHGEVGNLVFAPGTNVFETTPITGNPFTQNNEKWLFGPRVGLAWDVFGNGKTAVRSAFGSHYQLLDSLGNYFSITSPYNAQYTFPSNPNFLTLIPIQGGVTPPPQCSPTVTTGCIDFASNAVNTLGSNGAALKVPTMEEWDLSIQQQIVPNTSVTVGYVGSHGYHILANADYNAIAPLVCTASAGCVSGGLNKTTGMVPNGALYIPVTTTPNPYLGSGLSRTSVGTSSYNGLQVDVDHKLSGGLVLRANYVWAKDLDISSTEINGAVNAPNTIEDPYNPRLDWGPSAFNIKSSASISALYNLPIGKGEVWLSGVSGVADKLISGWQLNSIVGLATGLPLTIQVGSNQSGNGDTQTPDRPNWNPAFSGPVIVGKPHEWFNPNAFSLPTSGTWGNVSRGALTGPGLAEWDCSLFKNTTITERLRVQFRAEGFNVVNRANFDTPNDSVFSGGVISPSAGVITGTATTSRQIQFGLKANF
jgi:Carboxypeptidase regulatory-like domain/TonB-dependent Receptor Plug Domain